MEYRTDTLHVFESAIDMLSYATLIKRKGFDWKRLKIGAECGYGYYDSPILL